MTSKLAKVAPVFDNNIKQYFKVNQDKRIAYHQLFQDYINRTEPKYLPAKAIDSLMVLFQHDHGIHPTNQKKALDFLKQDLEFSKFYIGEYPLRSFKLRIRLYEILCGDCDSDLAIKLVKESGHYSASVQCLLLRIMYKEKGSVACYDWMKSLLTEPTGVDVKNQGPTFYKWSHLSCNLLLHYLCTDKELDFALEVIKDMERLQISVNIRSYNSLLSCFSRTCDYQGAVDTFGKLKRKRLKPNQVTYNWMINCALRSQEYFCLIRIEKPMEEAQKYRDMMKDRGFHENAWTVNSIMAYYVTKSDWDQVLEVYRNARDCNIKTYTMVLVAAFNKRCITTVIKTLEDFQTKDVGFDPTMHSVCVDGLRKMKLFEDARVREVMKEMEENYVGNRFHWQETFEELIDKLVDILVSLKQEKRIK